MFSTRKVALRHLAGCRSVQRYAHDVRVRFAPSPTGHLHLGGLRTALYNFLFARSQRGKFLLRIEDTDQTRLVPGATESLIEDLLWAGIEIDEGPGFGGDCGPYTQSERTKIYTGAIAVLLENRTAYRCFCTERRLELLRHEAVRTRQVPRYDNKCRHLTTEQVAQLLDKQTPHCIRFRLTDNDEPLDDLIYGRVQHNVCDTEGDPVIMKSDDFPTYHFANVVDDHRMGITHVFRGVEWQISTPKHLLLYKAFGWKPPKYGHLPLLVNADGTKLSKRQGDIGIKHFRDRGYFPESVVNYVISAGGGFSREPSSLKPQIYTMSELSQQFNIELVNSHPSRLNPDLLDDFNRLEISRRLHGPATTTELVHEVAALVKQTFGESGEQLDLCPQHIENVLRWSVNRLTFVADVVSPQLRFLWVKPTSYVLSDVSEQQIQGLVERLECVEFGKDTLNQTLRAFAKEQRLKFAPLMKTLRSILSGLKEGPGVAEMMEILGKDVVLRSLENALKASAPAQEESKCSAK